MTVCVIPGRGGTGKTSQIRTIAQFFESYRWAIMEIKDIRTFKDIPTDTIVSIGDDYKINPVKTLHNFNQWKNAIITGNELKCVVVDGISDLRNYAMDEWLIHDNERRSADGRTKRKTIGGDNIGAWGAINDRVRSLLEPLINYGLTTGTHVFFTAEMKQVYRNGKVIGLEPNIKEWIEYPCECIITLKSDGSKFWCESTKVPLWSNGVFSETLEKDTGLMRVMAQYGLL